jgi:hypothetical protein
MGGGMIRLRYVHLGYPKTVLSVFFKTEKQAAAFKQKNTDYIFLDE